MTGRATSHRVRLILGVLRQPPVGVGIVCLIVGATGGHMAVLELVWVSYVLGYLTARLRP